MASALRIGILGGSVRANGNALGMIPWAISLVNRAAASPSLELKSKPTIIALPSKEYPFYPLGPVKSPNLAGPITDSSKYDSANVRTWSEFVRSLHGILIVSPEYNWGYPGELKNSLDHLFNEWKAKPVALLTYGAFGGANARGMLKTVVESGLHMQYVGEAGVTLPGEYIMGDKRVGKVGGDDKWLEEYEGGVLEAVTKLVEATKLSQVMEGKIKKSS